MATINLTAHQARQGEQGINGGETMDHSTNDQLDDRADSEPAFEISQAAIERAKIIIQYDIPYDLTVDFRPEVLARMSEEEKQKYRYRC